METSKNSTRQLTLDELISSQEGSPANPTAWQESERERRTNATCGQRCCALFENAPRGTSWAKTFAALLVGMEGWSSRRCALTWRLVGTPYNRSYFQLAVSVLPTEEIASGLLLTPTSTERCEHPDDMRARAEKNGYKNGTKYNSLTSQIVYGMLPTPVASDHQNRWPTENWKGDSDLPSVVNGQLGTRSQLSPLFVEEMMGFPRNWTASPFQSGDEKA
jgi:hypothetical protein